MGLTGVFPYLQFFLPVFPEGLLLVSPAKVSDEANQCHLAPPPVRRRYPAATSNTTKVPKQNVSSSILVTSIPPHLSPSPFPGSHPSFSSDHENPPQGAGSAHLITVLYGPSNPTPQVIRASLRRRFLSVAHPTAPEPPWQPLRSMARRSPRISGRV